jgi:hypothetical protein
MRAERGQGDAALGVWVDVEPGSRPEGAGPSRPARPVTIRPAAAASPTAWVSGVKPARSTNRIVVSISPGTAVGGRGVLGQMEEQVLAQCSLVRLAVEEEHRGFDQAAERLADRGGGRGQLPAGETLGARLLVHVVVEQAGLGLGHRAEQIALGLACPGNGLWGDAAPLDELHRARPFDVAGRQRIASARQEPEVSPPAERGDGGRRGLGDLIDPECGACVAGVVHRCTHVFTRSR